MTDTLTLPVDFSLYNRYTIKATIGQGGFGITYLAQDEQLDVSVCIKELFIGGSSTRSTNMTVQSQSMGEDFSFDEFVERFLLEARQLAKFRHPNIVRVTDVFNANNTAYMVMDFVEGETLKERIGRTGALREKTALDIFGQLLDAIEIVHEKGMLHRDIKPDNVLVTQDNKIVLIDFGSAREFAEGKTTTQTAMLTPGYAPIEQYSNRAQRGTFTDIYALGATLYFMLTGEKPIPSTDRVHEELSAPYDVNKQVSTQLSSAVMMAMAMKPEDRFQGIADFKQAIALLHEQSRAEDSLKTSTNDNTNKGTEPKGTAGGNKESTSWQRPLTFSSIQDIAGNEYKAVSIGSQVWMTENLNVDRFRNGDPIQEVKTDEEWIIAGEENRPAWCYYENNPANGDSYGKIYNWQAVNDPRGLAPTGWHIPSDDEWTILTDYLGISEAGLMMKSKNSWYNGGNGNNSSGFSGLPVGPRYINGKFGFIDMYVYWWSSSEASARSAWLRGLYYSSDLVSKDFNNKAIGLSIRCLRD